MPIKRWSVSYTRSLILALAFIVTLTCMALFMVSAGLRCVDTNGCLREHCLAFYDRF